MIEFGYFIALIGCIAALTRRVVFTPEKLKGKSQLEGNFILVLIFIITTTSYVIESIESPSSITEPIGFWVKSLELSDNVVYFLLGSYDCNLFILNFNSSIKTYAFSNGISKCIFP